MPSTISTQVRTVGGDALEFDVAETDTVEELKSRIEARLQVPPLFQKLIHGTSVLEDGSAFVGSLLEPVAAPLVLTLVLSTDSLCREMALSWECCPWNAMINLVQNALHGSALAQGVLGSCVCHPPDEYGQNPVRYVSIEAVRDTANRMDLQLLSARVPSMLVSESGGVRCLGAMLFGQVLSRGRGDEEVTLEEAVEELDEELGPVVLDPAVAAVAGRCGDRVIATMLTLLDDQDQNVKQWTLTNIKDLAQDAVFADLLRERSFIDKIVESALKDPEPDTRVCAARALVPMTRLQVAAGSALEQLTWQPPGQCSGEAVLPAVLAILEDPEPSVREVMMGMLKDFIEMDLKDARSVELIRQALLRHLRDASYGIRELAVRTLAMHVFAGDARTMRALAACLDDEHIWVKRGVVEALPQAMTEFHAESAADVVARFHHSEPFSRRAAVDTADALKQKFPESESTLLQAAEGMLADSDAMVQYAASRMLGLEW